MHSSEKKIASAAYHDYRRNGPHNKNWHVTFSSVAHPSSTSPIAACSRPQPVPGWGPFPSGDSQILPASPVRVGCTSEQNRRCRSRIIVPVKMEQRHATTAFQPTDGLDDRAKERAAQLLKEAESTPPGYQRDRLLQRARQAEIVSQMQEWLSSPGLRAAEVRGRLQAFVLAEVWPRCFASRGSASGK